MRRARSRTALLAVLALTFAGALGARASAEDVLVLTSGREVRGRLLAETEERVQFDVGGGSVWYPRERIREIRRGTLEDENADENADAGPARRAAREEQALLYTDGVRVGTRTLRVLEREDGWQFEEHRLFLGPAGRPQREVRYIERSDAEFAPVFFQLQERRFPERKRSGEGTVRLVRGTAAGLQLSLTITQRGESERRVLPAPTRARFPLAARELFLREERALAGRLDCDVFDVRRLAWVSVAYASLGEKPVEQGGAVVSVRVLRRRQDGVVETEWIAPDLTAPLADLGGTGVRALAATAEQVAAVQRGETDRVTGPDSAARTRYADSVAGFAVQKPDPSWTFEEPAVPGAGALLAVRNRPLGASVDVLQDEAPPDGVTIERAAEALQRLLRAHASDVRVEKEGYVGEGDDRTYWLLARATTKGERTRTLARVVLAGGRVYRLLAACPESRFDACRPDFDAILDSFKIL